MKVIIAGSRTITDRNVVHDVMADNPFINTSYQGHVIVSGGAKGVDTLAKEFAEYCGALYKEFPANWEKHGKSAGYKRNAEMAEYADVLVAIWDGKSKGTRHMINLMLDAGKDVYVAVYKDE